MVKKGFTLVELIVAIAILSILASVSVVAYLGFTKKALNSNDLTLVTEMNKVLTSEKIFNEVDVINDSVRLLKKHGIKESDLKLQNKENVLIYDDLNGEFLIKSREELENKENNLYYWAFVKNENELNLALNYDLNTYLVEDFPDREMLKTHRGLDVGVNKIKNIIIEAPKVKKNLDKDNNLNSLKLRTLDSKVSLKHPNLTLDHYGDAREITVYEKANLKLHSSLDYLSLKESNVEVSNGSVVNVIYIEDSTNLELNIKEMGQVKKIYKKNSIDNESLQISGFPIDAIENLHEDDHLGTIFFNGGVGTLEKPFIISSRRQLSNVGEFANVNYHYKFSDNLILDLSDWEPIDFNGTLEGNNAKIINLDNYLFLNIGNLLYIPGKSIFEEAVIKDLSIDVNLNFENASLFKGNLGAVVKETGQKIILENLKVSGVINGKNASALFGNIDNYLDKLTLKNNSVTAVINGNSGMDNLYYLENKALINKIQIIK